MKRLCKPQSKPLNVQLLSHCPDFRSAWSLDFTNCFKTTLNFSSLLFYGNYLFLWPIMNLFSQFLHKARQAEMQGRGKVRTCLVQCPAARSPQAAVSSCVLSKIGLDGRCWKKPDFTGDNVGNLGVLCTRLLSVTPISLVSMLPCGMADQLRKQWFCSKAAHFYSIYCELCMNSSSGDPRGTTCHKVFCCAEKSIPVSQLPWKAWTFDPGMLKKNFLFSKPISWAMKCLT